MIDVAIIDNDQMLLGAAGQEWLGQHGAPIRVVAAAGTVAEFLALEAEQRPVIVLLDLLLRDGTHVPDNVRALVQAGHTVIVMSSENHDGRILAAIDAGAHSYVHKARDPAELTEAILAASAGQPYTSREEAAAHDARHGMIHLAPREREAVERFISGMKVADVASSMDIAPDTVRKYLVRIKDRFGETGRQVSTRTELRTELIRDGLITPAD